MSLDRSPPLSRMCNFDMFRDFFAFLEFLCKLFFQWNLNGTDEVAMESEVCYNLSREVGVHL